MATLSQVQEVVFRLKLEDQATDAMKAAVATLKELNKEFDLNDQVVQKAGKGANALINQNDQISKTAKTLTNVLRDLSDAQKALAIDAATGGEKQAALLRTVENLTTKVQTATQAHNDAVKGVKSVGDAHDDAAKKIGLFGLSAQKTGFLVHDATKAIESLTLGMSPLQVAMQHVGQVQSLFGGLGEAVKSIGASFISVPGAMLAATAALVGFGVAAEHESTRLGDLRQQLRATHDDYLTLADSVDKAAKVSAASSTLTTAQAREAAQTIASAKYFSGTTDDLILLTKASADLAREWGGDLAKAGAFLRDAIDDPGKKAKEMADTRMFGMTATLADALVKMQAAGQGGKALDEVLRLVLQHTAGATQDVSPLGKALHDLGQTFTVAKDGGKSLSIQIGEMVDSFLALQVRGLDNVIKGLEGFIQKMQAAGEATKKAFPNSYTGFNVDPGGLSGPIQMPTATGSVSSGGSSISQVDPGIRTLVEAAAKQNQLDTELLARLQLAENAKPLGKDLGGNPVFATSSTGNIGPMQVGPATFAGMQNLPYGTQFQGQALGNNATNVNAGAAYFSYLLTKYGDVKIAVMAYQDGETRMDKVLNGGGRVSSSQEAIDEALKVTRGYTGTGRATSAGPAFPGESLTAQNAAGFVGSTAGSGVSPGIRAEAASVLDDAQKAAQGLSLIAASRDKLIEQQHLFEAALNIPNQTPGQLDTWQKALDRVKGELNDSLTPAQAYVRSLTDQLPAAVALTEGDRRLAEVQKALADQERSQPGSVTPEIRAQAIAAAVDLQSAAYKKQVFDIETSIQAQDKITAAYGQGYAAVAHVTAQTQAYNAALSIAPRGSDQFKAAVAGLTVEYERQAQGARNAQIAAATLGNKDQLEFLQAETASLGTNDNARTAMLNHLKAEQELKNKTIDAESALGKAYLASVDSISSQTAAFKLQEASLNEVKGFFTSTFDTISNAITQAFATGNLAALKFKDIAKSVASAVIAEFSKLAIINPLKNWLTGETSPTLSSVGGVLGNLFGGSGVDSPVSAVASVVSAGSSAAHLFDQPGTTFDSAGNLASATAGSSTANGGGFSLFSAAGLGSTLLGFAEKLGITGAGGIVSKLTDTVKAISNYSLYASSSGLEGAITTAAGQDALASAVAKNLISDSTSVAGGGTVQALDGINVTLGSAVGAIGGIYSAIQGFQRGGVGGAVQGVAGIAGAGLAVAGTGVLGAGAAGLAAAAGPYAPIALAAIAIIGALLPGGHPLNPYDATGVDAQDGKLAVGKTATQAMQATSLSTVTDFVDGVNDFMAQAHLILENGNGQLGAIGQGIKGMAGLVTDPNKILETLRFKNDPTDTSQFGVAKGALEGMSFPNAQALTDELIKIASFADATAALGLKLDSVGRDITNIHVGSVEGINPNQTATVTDANGNSVQYLNDLRTALTNDLPRQTWANVEALDAEINTVNQFVNGTIPGLLHPIEQTTSSIVDAVAKVDATYQQAIAQSESYGLDNARVLNDAEQQAIAIIRKSGLEAISASQTQVKDRFDVASGGGLLAAGRQTNDNFDLQAQQQRNALDKQLTDTFGDGVRAWGSYADQMNALEATLGAERLATAKQVAKQIAAAEQSILDTDSSLWARLAAANGDQQGANLLNFDVKAQQERRSFSDQLLATYGDAFASNQGYADNMLLLERTLAAERIAIAKQTVKQIAGAEQSILDADDSLWARLAAANGNQEGADLLNFDVKARQERQAFSDQLLATYGDAFAANQGYADNMTLLEQTLAAERLQIVQKYGNAVNGATAEQIKSAQGSVASLFTSLGDYVTKLQGGTNSPLSPTAQYDFAKNQFNAVAGAAAAGDATSAGKLTGFSDTFLSASRAVYGSGAGYAADFNKVIDAIQSVVQAPTDALTNSFLALQLQQQTASITQAQQATTDAVNALRREIMQQSRLQATQANAA